jgi:hypothetical protein
MSPGRSGRSLGNPGRPYKPKRQAETTPRANSAGQQPRPMTARAVRSIIAAMNSPMDPGALTSLADLRRKLEELRSEHRDLDDVIARLQEAAPFNQLQLQRLKKRKLMLKDQITQLESKLLPDIIA